MVVQSYLESPTHPADGGGSAGNRSEQAVPPPRPSRLSQALSLAHLKPVQYPSAYLFPQAHRSHQ